jgi:hypothetical protein
MPRSERSPTPAFEQQSVDVVARRAHPCGGSPASTTATARRPEGTLEITRVRDRTGRSSRPDATYQSGIRDLLLSNMQAKEGKLMRMLLLTVGVIVAAVLTIGINRIVVTDGHIGAVATQTPPIEAQVVAFKSDYFPLERQARA